MSAGLQRCNHAASDRRAAFARPLPGQVRPLPGLDAVPGGSLRPPHRERRGPPAAARGLPASESRGSRCGRCGHGSRSPYSCRSPCSRPLWSLSSGVPAPSVQPEEQRLVQRPLRVPVAAGTAQPCPGLGLQPHFSPGKDEKRVCNPPDALSVPPSPAVTQAGAGTPQPPRRLRPAPRAAGDLLVRQEPLVLLLQTKMIPGIISHLM